MWGGAISTLIEWNCFGGAHALFLGSVMMLAAMMSYALVNETCHNKWLMKINIIGNRYSSAIYIIHMAFIAMLKLYADPWFVNGNRYVKMVYLAMKPFFVIGLSLLCAMGTERIRTIIRRGTK